MELSNGSYVYATRPLTGTLGSATAFPAPMGQNGSPVPAFDAAGDAVFIEVNPSTGGKAVVWRSADGTFGNVQRMPTGFNPTLVAVAPNGDAVVGFQGNNNNGGAGPVQVAFRPGGATSSVDTGNAESFSTDGTLVGLTLQADGSVVVVY